MSHHTTIDISWDDVTLFIESLAENLKDEPPKGVYGIPRGGLVPAVMLSHRMHIPLLLAPKKGCIVVDDISDSGDTLMPYMKKGYITATICEREGTSCPPNHSLRIIHDESWAVFPWEVGTDEGM